MWTAERVWESNLAGAISTAGIQYTMLDDTHFRMAGLRNRELFGYYLTEEQGQTLKLVPSSMQIRYMVPFADPSETINYLRAQAEGTDHDLLIATGDDTEKFGVWPRTFTLCYKKGWLDRFYDALARESDWLQTVRLGDYLQSSEPTGRIYLPTASYDEMMEWALPANISQEFVDLKHELGHAPWAQKLAQFLHGGYWRNFLVRYRESNLIQKKMLQISRRVRTLYHRYQTTPAPITIGPADNPTVTQIKAAYDYLLQGQCNDAFWHGVFGGLYAPNLRSALLTSLIQSETLLDKIEYGEDRSWLQVETTDFDGDGLPEVVVNTADFAMVYDRKEGGVSILDFKPRQFSLINSLQRRLEAYHQKVHEIALEEAKEAKEAKNVSPPPAANDASEEIETIHGIAKVKERGLDRFLVYDCYPRNCFTIYILDDSTVLADFANQQLAQKALILREGQVTLDRNGHTLGLNVDYQFVPKVSISEPLNIGQVINFTAGDATVKSSLSVKTPSFSKRLAVEFNINLLAGDAHDRYFRVGPEQARLHWQGVVNQQSLIEMFDEYFRVAVQLRSNRPIDWWIYPVFSVSQSEEGFERVYQGSTILAILDFNQNDNRSVELELQALAL
jgi:alpha-amylase